MRILKPNLRLSAIDESFCERAFVTTNSNPCRRPYSTCLRAKLKDLRAPLADIFRLIAARMAGVIEEMQQVTSSIQLRALQAEVKGLRTMTKVLIDAHRCQPRE